MLFRSSEIVHYIVPPNLKLPSSFWPLYRYFPLPFPKSGNFCNFLIDLRLQIATLTTLFMTALTIKTFDSHWVLRLFEIMVSRQCEPRLILSSVQINLLFHRQDQRRRGVMAISEYRPFIRALFHFGPKLGVPATLVVPLGSEIEKGMLSRPGRVIVSCGSHIEEVRISKHQSPFFFP